MSVYAFFARARGNTPFAMQLGVPEAFASLSLEQAVTDSSEDVCTESLPLPRVCVLAFLLVQLSY